MLWVVCAGTMGHISRAAVWGGLKGPVVNGGWMDGDGKHVAGPIRGWIDRKLEE